MIYICIRILRNIFDERERMRHRGALSYSDSPANDVGIENETDAKREMGNGV